MEQYIRKFKESSITNLKDTSLVDKIYQYFYEHPFPQDHEGIHKFAESIGIEADIVEEYIYAMLSVFICGGKAYDAQKTEKDFDEKFIKSGVPIEYEHLNYNTENEVINYIAEKFSKRIVMDHLVESSPLNYYIPYLKDMEDIIKKDK